MQMRQQVDFWVEKAFEYFQEMQDARLAPSIYTYNAMLDVCAKASLRKHKGAEFLRRGVMIWKDMRRERIRPNDITYLKLLDLCNSCAASRVKDRAVSTQAFEVAMDVYDHIQGKRRRTSPVVYSILFNVARREATSASVDKAYAIFQDMDSSSRNKHTYTSMMSALSAVGRWREAVDLLETGRKEGIKPDRIMYSVCMEAIGHLPDQVLNLHKRMISEGIEDDHITARLVERVGGFKGALRRRERPPPSQASTGNRRRSWSRFST